MLKLHHLNNSRSQRILWLLEELDVEYDIVKYQRDAKTNLAPEQLKKIHSLGKSPVITDELNGEKVTLAESAAIVDYLANRYSDGKLIPARDTKAYIDYNYWMHFSEGSLMAMLIVKMMFDRVRVAPLPFFLKPVARKIADGAMAAYPGPNIKNMMIMLEDHLSKNTWFLGDEISAADIQMSFPLEATVARGGAEQLPNIKTFVERFQARPAYQRALDKGGQYDFAV